ncbi:MAG: hypothetical protein MK078_17855 [Crocinitomicaceae bacterium]|nr:hypothetical protein [Crocinitomicaceae bacterium]MCH2236102.1 hypothetical protein [Crocinitomicaceae bacterium]
MMKKSNRYRGFWNSDAPLTSKKGQWVISDPKNSAALIKAVRYSKHEWTKATRSGKFAEPKVVKVAFTKEDALKLKDL